MAYTKIKPIRMTLQKCIQYTLNPNKTETVSPVQIVLTYTHNDEKTEERTYVTGFHCTPETAYQTMEQTCRFWGKDRKGHVQGYHVIQSFAPGEVTPEQAHKIGCEFVSRALSGFEATVSTHLDQKHLHNHIVFNSVSFLDGKMFRDDYRGYYLGIRRQSDEICKEQGLSIIDPKNKGKSYAERLAEEQGRPTARGQIRKDVDLAIEKSVSWQTFILNLQRMGYVVRYGSNVKYATVCHKQGKKAIRLKSLGDGYSEDEIKKRIVQNEVQFASSPNVPPLVHRHVSRYRGHFPILPKQKSTGFMALYYRYLYLFRKAGKKGYSAKRTQYLLRDDLAKFDRYVMQASFIWSYHIESFAQLEQVKTGSEQCIHNLTGERNQLYRKRKHQAEHVDNVETNKQIRILTEELQVQRRVVSVCNEIKENIAHLQQQLIKAQQQELEIQKQEDRKERMKHEHRR